MLNRSVSSPLSVCMPFMMSRQDIYHGPAYALASNITTSEKLSTILDQLQCLVIDLLLTRFELESKRHTEIPSQLRRRARLDIYRLVLAVTKIAARHCAERQRHSVLAIKAGGATLWKTTHAPISTQSRLAVLFSGQKTNVSIFIRNSQERQS